MMSGSYPSLGKYQVLEEIGRGGMGAVYKGYDPALDRTVAIKLLAPHLVWEKGFVERFLREARAAARLQHPNIIAVYDVGQDGDNNYFVMAYLPGPSLKHMISHKGRLVPVEALPILRQLADALDYAHSKGLVHRDVKPANVMLDERGRAILTDFGIVKAAQEGKITTAGAVMGTPQYMAPEQVQAKDIDACTDQYALGTIAFEMLTGRVPFDAETVTAVLHKQVYEPPPSILSGCPTLPAAVEGVVNRVLSKLPGERYGSCGEFVDALEQALAQCSTEPLPKPLAEPKRKMQLATVPTLQTQSAAPAHPPRNLLQMARLLAPDPRRHWFVFNGAAALLATGYTYFVTDALPYYPVGWRGLILIILAGLWVYAPTPGLALTLAAYTLPVAYNSILLAVVYLAAFLFLGSLRILNPYSFLVLAAMAVPLSQTQLTGLLLIAPLAMGFLGSRRGAVLGALACLWVEVLALLAGRASVGLLVTGQTVPIISIQSAPVSSLLDFSWWSAQTSTGLSTDVLAKLTMPFVELPILSGQMILWAVAAGTTGTLLYRSPSRSIPTRLLAVGCGALILGVGHLTLSALLAGESIEINRLALDVLVPAVFVALTSPILEAASSALVPPQPAEPEEATMGEVLSETGDEQPV